MPLLFNGGLTKTHMPYATSEVIDQGDSSAVAGQNDIPRYDQRGRPFDRVLDGDEDGNLDIDIGAVEYGIGDPTGAPRVVDIVISGSQSVHDDYSFSEAFDEGIHEFTTVPVGGADTIEVVFSEWVNVSVSNLFLFGNYTKTVYTSPDSGWDIVDFAFDDETFTARWQFEDADSNTFPADMFLMGLSNASNGFVLDNDSNQLDGDWDIPFSLADQSPDSFPSGDGDAGDAFYFTFVILPGDYDLDNDADGVGFLQWQLMYDSGTDNTFTDGDYDGDGDVDGDDLAIWQDNFGLDFSSWYNYS